jgi:hypothetical protein
MHIDNTNFLDRPIMESDAGLVITRNGEWRVFTTAVSGYDPENLPEEVERQGRAVMRLVLALQDPELMAELDRRLDAEIAKADALTPANLH